MSVEVLMPALSPTMEEGTLAKWLVKVGDKVRSGDVIAEIETDKATMEVEAVDEGVVDALLVAEGAEEVKVNTPIARLRGEGEAAGPPAAAPAAQPVAVKPQPAPAEPPPEAKSADSQPAPPPPAPSPRGGGEAEPQPAKTLQPKTEDGGERIMASPLAKRLAAQLGLDLGQIKGSGPHGRIVRADVEAHQGGAKASCGRSPSQGRRPPRPRPSRRSPTS